MKKRKSSSASTKLKKRLTTMATKRKRSAPRRKTSSPRKTKRRRRTLSAGGPTKKGIVSKALNIGLTGVAGGGLYTVPQTFMTMGTWGKILTAAAIAAGAVYFDKGNGNNGKQVASGAIGALTYDLGSKLFSLKDESLEDIEYVDPNTLSDTDMLDEDGNPVMMDDEGTVYALNDDGDFQAIGDIYDLQDGSDLQSVSMLPLQDAYSLQDPYALAAGY